MTTLVLLLAAMLIAPVTPAPKGSAKARSSRPAAKARLTPSPEAEVVRGTLLDVNGSPIAGRTIYLLDFRGGEREVILPTGDRAIERSESVSCNWVEGKIDHAESTTDTAGRFSIPLRQFYLRRGMDLYRGVIPTGALGYLEKDSCLGFRKQDDMFVIVELVGLASKDLGEVKVKLPWLPAATPSPTP